MSTRYETAVGDAQFGDVFGADWLYDAYLRGDATALVRFTAKGQPNAFAPARAAPDRDFLLAHGRPCAAILLGDDCEIVTMTRRGGSSRLLFAALAQWPVAPSEAERARSTSSFRRHPLPPGSTFAGGIVEFQQLFAVAAETVSSGAPARLARLSDTERIALEIRWCAYATRRGPRAHLDGATKLAEILTAGGSPERLHAIRNGEGSVREDARTASIAVADALGHSWNIEGACLGAVAEAHESATSPNESVTALIEALEGLAESATAAANALRDAHAQG